MPGADPDPRTRHGDAALLRVLGSWAIAASIINITIGGSIFALPGVLAAAMGSAAPLAFVLGALLFIPITLCFAAAGSRVTASGGPYIYVGEAFGQFPAIAIAGILWISSVTGSGSMSAVLADQLAQVAPSLGQPAPRALFLFAVYGVLVGLNAFGIRIGAAAIAAFAAAKALPLLLLAAFGWRYVHVENLSVHPFPNWTSVGTSLVLVVFAYSGIEIALAPSGEVRDPARALPKAALAGVAVIITLYVGLQLVAQGVLGAALAGNNAPLAAIAELIVAGAGGLVVLTATVSLIGVLLGDLLGSSRLLFALARDGFLPATLAAVSKRRAPLRAVALHALLAWLLAVAGSFGGLALVSGGALCLVYVACCAAAWELQRTNKSATQAPFALRGGPLIPLVGGAGMLLILSALRWAEWIALGGAALAVTVLYGARRWGRTGTY